MFIAIPGSTSIGSVMLCMADIEGKKVSEGTVLDYSLHDCKLIQDRGKSAPVSVWELADTDLSKYEEVCGNSMLRRQVYVGKQKAWVYYKQKS